VRDLPGNVRDLAVDTATGALGRARQGVASERDQQIAGAISAAMTQLQRDAPGLYGPILADFQRAAVATSTTVMDAALRRAVTALLIAEPWLADRVVGLSRNAGGAAAESGLAATARKVAPWAIGGLIVAVFVYGVTTTGQRR
jgi:hypothetical protein